MIDMILIKKIAPLLLCMFIGTSAMAQREISGEPFKLKDRLYYGGNVGASFSSNYSYFNVSPRIGCMINNNFSVGTGVTYLYMNNNAVGSSVYGGNIFARYNIFQNFFAQTEVEELNTRYSYVINNELFSRRIWVPGWFIGGGIYQRISGRAGLSLAGFYNILYDSKRSPYNSPFVVRAGFNF